MKPNRWSSVPVAVDSVAAVAVVPAVESAIAGKRLTLIE
jgi:hypothetical protein